MNLVRSLIERNLAAFERRWNYDVSYLRAVLACGTGAFRPMLAVQRIGAYRKGLPIAPWFAAKVVATLAEDCGPCVQLGVTMAEQAGIDPATLRAVLARDFDAMPPDVALVVRFTEAVLRHAPEADDLRAEIRARWGEDAVVTLAYAILSGRSYPTLKYALGYGQACTRVSVAGVPAPLHAPAAVS